MVATPQFTNLGSGGISSILDESEYTAALKEVVPDASEREKVFLPSTDLRDGDDILKEALPMSKDAIESALRRFALPSTNLERSDLETVLSTTSSAVDKLRAVARIKMVTRLRAQQEAAAEIADLETFGQDKAIPLYRLYSWIASDHFYCVWADEADNAQRIGYTREEPMGRVLPQAMYGAIALNRSFNGRDHFYTADLDEHIRATTTHGYRDEGNAGYVFEKRVKGTIPLFRAYNPSNGNHFYTINEPEYHNACNNQGYKREGIVGYVFRNRAPGQP